MSEITLVVIKSMKNLICPLCGSDYMKAIYMGFPLKICSEQSCSCAQGYPAVWLMEHIPPMTEIEQERGWALYMYEGSYWRALWGYLFDKHED